MGVFYRWYIVDNFFRLSTACVAKRQNLPFLLIASSHQKNSEINFCPAKIWHNQKMHIFDYLWFSSEFLTIFLSKVAFLLY